MPKPQQNKNDDPFGYAPSWRPDKHDDAEWKKAALEEFGSVHTDPQLEGVFTDVNEGFSDYGTYPIVVLVTDNGEEFAWHAMTDIAQQQLLKANPEIGHRLLIAYGGKKEGKTPGHEPYTRWMVRNLTVTPEDRAKSILGKFRRPEGNGGNENAKKRSDFDDDPPF